MAGRNGELQTQSENESKSEENDEKEFEWDFIAFQAELPQGSNTLFDVEELNNYSIEIECPEIGEIFKNETSFIHFKEETPSGVSRTIWMRVGLTQQIAQLIRTTEPSVIPTLDQPDIVAASLDINFMVSEYLRGPRANFNVFQSHLSENHSDNMNTMDVRLVEDVLLNFLLRPCQSHHVDYQMWFEYGNPEHHLLATKIKYRVCLIFKCNCGVERDMQEILTKIKNNEPYTVTSDQIRKLYTDFDSGVVPKYYAIFRDGEPEPESSSTNVEDADADLLVENNSSSYEFSVWDIVPVVGSIRAMQRGFNHFEEGDNVMGYLNVGIGAACLVSDFVLLGRIALLATGALAGAGKVATQTAVSTASEQVAKNVGKKAGEKVAVAKEGAKGAAKQVAKEGAKQVAKEGARQLAKEGVKQVAKEGTKQLAKESVKQVVKEGTKQIAKEGVKQVVKEGTKQLAKESVKQVVKEGTKQIVKEGTKQVVKEGVKQVVKEGTKQVVKEGVKQVVKEGTKQVVKEGVKQVVKEGTKQVVKEGVKQVVKEGTKQVVKEGVKQVVKEGTKQLAKEGVKQVVKEGTKQLAKESVKQEVKEGTKQVIKEGTKQLAKETVKQVTMEGVNLGVKDLVKELAMEVGKNLYQSVISHVPDMIDYVKNNNNAKSNPTVIQLSPAADNNENGRPMTQSGETAMNASANNHHHDPVQHSFSEENATSTVKEMKQVAKEGTKQLAKESVKQVVKEGTKQIAKEGVKQVVKEGTKQLAKESVKLVVKEGTKQVVKEGVKQVVKEGTKQVVKEGVKPVVKEGTKQVVKEGVKQVVKEGTKQLAKEGVKQVVKEGTKQVVKEGVKQVVKEGTKQLAKDGFKQVVKEGTKQLAKSGETAMNASANNHHHDPVQHSFSEENATSTVKEMNGNKEVKLDSNLIPRTGGNQNNAEPTTWQDTENSRAKEKNPGQRSGDRGQKIIIRGLQLNQFQSLKDQVSFWFRDYLRINVSLTQVKHAGFDKNGRTMIIVTCDNAEDETKILNEKGFLRKVKSPVFIWKDNGFPTPQESKNGHREDRRMNFMISGADFNQSASLLIQVEEWLATVFNLNIQLAKAQQVGTDDDGKMKILVTVYKLQDKQMILNKKPILKMSLSPIYMTDLWGPYDDGNKVIIRGGMFCNPLQYSAEQFLCHSLHVDVQVVAAHVIKEGTTDISVQLKTNAQKKEVLKKQEILKSMGSPISITDDEPY